MGRVVTWKFVVDVVDVVVGRRPEERLSDPCCNK